MCRSSNRRARHEDSIAMLPTAGCRGNLTMLRGTPLPGRLLFGHYTTDEHSAKQRASCQRAASTRHAPLDCSSELRGQPGAGLPHRVTEKRRVEGGDQRNDLFFVDGTAVTLEA